METRWEATSVAGFIQQLAVSYVGRGYVFFVTGVVPAHKDPARVDQKLTARYGVGISKWAKARRRSSGVASHAYIRHGHFFVLLATHGQSSFFEEEGERIKDARKTPIRYAGYPWMYPLVSFAAHTGARRSELLRAEVADVDVDGGVVTIREMKRVRGERTTRRVPLTPFLKGVLTDWLAAHPGGPYLFCHAGVVARSRKRSRTTGHRAGVDRPTTRAGRIAAVSRRTLPTVAALTRNEVHHHFKTALRGSKWEPLRGLHTLRHSFISACASKGVDQRLVEEWCGHMDEETSRRYRHLWPSVQEEAIRSVF